MPRNQKLDIILTTVIVIAGLTVIYFTNKFMNPIVMSTFSIGIVVLTTLPVQLRKKKQRQLISEILNQNNTTLQEDIYKNTQITLNQLKIYTISGNGISSTKIYKIEEIIARHATPQSSLS